MLDGRVVREPLGVILAGGRGSRMGGLPKAALQLGSTTLLERCVDRLDPQVDGIVVNSNTPLSTALPVVADTLDGHLGPLAGVLAGLDWAAKQGHDHIVTVAVDTPFFPCDLVPRLMLAATNGFAIATTDTGPHGTFGLWPTTLIDPLHAFLASGERKVRAFTQLHAAAKAHFPITTPDSFFNINTPEDLTAAGRLI